jgi:hypothetical protein
VSKLSEAAVLGVLRHMQAGRLRVKRLTGRRVEVEEAALGSGNVRYVDLNLRDRAKVRPLYSYSVYWMWWYLHSMICVIRIESMPEEIQSYDPSSPEIPDLQTRAFVAMDINQLGIEELTNPQAVQFLVFHYKIAIEKNNELTKKLFLTEQKLEKVNIAREDLRVSLATMKEKSNKSWFEIPGAALIGFGTNYLTGNDAQLQDTGLALFITGIVLVIFSRGDEILSGFRSMINFFRSSKGSKND